MPRLSLPGLVSHRDIGYRPHVTENSRLGTLHVENGGGSAEQFGLYPSYGASEGAVIHCKASEIGL
jgi:hypothetical protein